MNRRRQLITYEEAKPAKGQHRKPCSDCPFARTALPGWLGSLTVEEWIQTAHGEAVLMCHTQLGAECAGGAIYRANVCKSVRDASQLRLRRDEVLVFATPKEFQDHHEGSNDAETQSRRRSPR